MSFPRRHFIILTAGGCAAVTVFVLGAGVVRAALDPGTDLSQSGALAIVFDPAAPSVKLEPAAQVRCYVDGAFAGEMPLQACGARNGAAAGAIDVGLQVAPDQSAYEAPALAASADQQGRDAASLANDEVRIPTEPSGVCEQRDGESWRALGGPVTAEDCAIMLFAGLCPRPDEVAQGRWNGRTISLADGRVELVRAGGGVTRVGATGLDCTLAASAIAAPG